MRLDFQAPRFTVLGPVRAWSGADEVALGSARQRAVLAMLVMRANHVVPRTAIVDGVWGDAAPASAVSNVQTYVARLRQALEPERQQGDSGRLLEWTGGGYLLRVRPEQIDVDVFQRAIAEARAARERGDWAAAREALSRGLELWQGPPLAGVEGPFAEAERVRLSEARTAALADQIEADLALGRHIDAVEELARLVREHPLHERLRGLQMLALYRSGRQAEGLSVFAGVRRLLVDELGVEPGPELQQLHAQILRNDPALVAVAAPAAGATGRPPAPAQLPRDVPGFGGRRFELARLHGLLRDGGAVVISAIDGIAGVGKTSLAVHFGHQAAGRFPDGQLYVNLRGFDPYRPPVEPGEALGHLLRSLGVPPPDIPAEVGEQAARYRSLLAGQRMLILLDDAASAEQVRRLLPGAPGCVVLVTSRHRLSGLVARDGVERIMLDVLEPDEAVRLLAGILGPDRVAGDPGAVRELAELCGCLPLALRIVAASLADRPQLSLAAAVAELAEGDRLGALEVDDDRETAVRGAFELSYRALDAPAETLWRRLGLMPGRDLSGQVAAIVTGSSVAAGQRGLAALAAANLVEQHGPDRYRLHDLLRVYAADRAGADDSDEDRAGVLSRLLGWYTLTARRATALVPGPKFGRLPDPDLDGGVAIPGFADTAEALAWLEAERENLVAVSLYAARSGPHPAAWYLPDALRGFFRLRRYGSDWLATGKAGLAAAASAADRTAEAAMRLTLAHAEWTLGRYEEAIEHYERGLAASRASGWRDGECGLLTGLGVVCHDAGRGKEALDYHAQALMIARELGSWQGEMINLACRANVLHMLGNIEEALADYDQVLRLFRETGDRDGEAATLGNMGNASMDLGRMDDAVGYLGAALDLYQKIGSRNGEANVREILSCVHREAGRYLPALDEARIGLTIAGDIGDRRIEVDCLNSAGSAYRQLSRAEEAVEHHRRALRISQEIGYRRGEAATLVELARCELSAGRVEAAREHAREAADLAHRTDHRLVEGRALTVLAEAHMTDGDHSAAAESCRRALALQRETGLRPDEARTLYLLGRILEVTVGPDAARPVWRDALAVFPGIPEADKIRALLD